MLDSTALMYFDSTDSEGKKVYLISTGRHFIASKLEMQSIRVNCPPLNLEALKYFLNEKWGTNLDTMWAYEPLISLKYSAGRYRRI